MLDMFLCLVLTVNIIRSSQQYKARLMFLLMENPLALDSIRFHSLSLEEIIWIFITAQRLISKTIL